MKPQIIRSEDVKEEDFGPIKVKVLFNTEDYEQLSFATIDVVGDQELGWDIGSDTFYYVLEGEGTFFIENEPHNVKKGDLVCIPKGTKYKDTVGLRLLGVATPRFDRDRRAREE